MTALNIFRELNRHDQNLEPALFIVNSGDRLSWYERDRASTFYRLFKRTFDIIVAMSALIFLLPIMLITAGLIKLDSKGPVFFHQNRCGKRGRQFRLWKFRSMCADSEKQKSALLALSDQAGLRFKMEADPRITRVGSFIRKYSIDEIPQLWNVVLGEMAIVGPRPPIPQEVKQYNVYQHRRLAVKPGITCTWQIEGRSKIPFEQQVDMDIAYIRTRSVLTDIGICLRTPIAVLTAKGAY